MAIPVQFQQFKAAGIYRVVYDKSTVLGTEAELLRLVVGYSPKGPFNTPVYIKSATDFIAMFGNISKTLEKRGCFFHRTCIQALEAGPILCLNLKKFETERVGVAAITNSLNYETTPVKSLFDTTRFWKLEPSNLDDVKVTGSEEDVYMHIASVDSKETSKTIFVRKPADSKLKSYDINVAEWYNTYGYEIPEYLVSENLTNLKLKDLFTEVYVFSGDFKGVENSSLKDYFEAYEVQTEGTETYKLEDLYVASALTDNVNKMYFVKADINEVTKITNDESGFSRGNTNVYKTVGVPGESLKWFESKELAYEYLVDETGENELHRLFNNHDFHELENPNEEGKYMITSLEGEDFEVFPYEPMLYNAAGYMQFAQRKNYEDAELVEYYPSYSSFVRNEDGSINEALSTIAFVGWTKTVTKLRVKDTINNAFGEPIDALDALYAEAGSGAVGYYLGCMLPNFYDPNYGYKAIDILFNLDSDNHHMMMSLNDSVLEKAGTIVGTLLTEDETTKEIIPNSFALLNTESNRIPTYIQGYTYSHAKPTSNSIFDKLEWQNAILDVLKDEKGLRDGLLSPAETDYRYIVDSFETFTSTNINYQIKSQLSLIAKQKELCFAILNFPSVSSLCKSEGRFTTNGVFNINKVVSGILLPSDANGGSFCAFYTPLKFSDGYVDTIVPSAGLVSNLFIAKYNGRAAYNIVAGPNYGNIQYSQLVGPDYNYSQEELNVIEPFGVNCMIYRPTFGTFINANQTAKQTPKTALSSVNVRELVIYLQDEIGKVLQSYQWEFNNPQTRQAIKAKADLICSRAKSDGGILEFLNVMDESNNTPDIIDNEMCVLSTSIEPGRGAGKMIHELTIYRTGGMKASVSEA